MNQYTLAFKQTANRILTLAYGREPSLDNIIEFTKQPLKYTYLDQQQRMEADYLAGKIADSIVFYNMQAGLYNTYLNQITIEPERLKVKYKRSYQEHVTNKTKLILKGLD
ncbi:hypothetical protein ACTEZU_16315 (plasmid) [Lactiplantibacillus plantarum]|uniref:hypothetical protein n=1 Tax=Lactiplantibacillus plantarum TaxID=1590 RepID=UPI003F7937A2